MRNLFRRFKKFLFGVDSTPPVEKKPAPKKPSLGKLRVAIIRGHSKRAQGADAFNGISEYDYWKKTNSLIGHTKHEIKEFTRDDGGITNACRHAGAWKADIIIETHFNSYNRSAKGCEALYIGSYSLAKSFCDFMAANYGKSNRGAKNLSGGGNGKYNIQQAESQAEDCILIEPFFGDNLNDYIEPQVMAKALTDFINTI